MSKAFPGKRVKVLLAHAIVVVLALGFVLSGCGAPSPAAPAPGAAPKAEAPPAQPSAEAPKPAAAPVSKAETPAPAQAAPASPKDEPVAAAKQGDRLVLASYTFANESPLGWENGEGGQCLWGQVFDPLIIVDPKTMELKPGLFTEWKPSADYKTWTFKVRQGVMFHDNWGEMTSEDIKFIFDKNRDPKATSEMASNFFSRVENIEAPDKYTLVMHMKNPEWGVPYFLDTIHNSNNIISKKYFEQVGEEEARLHPIGTGPYRFVDSKGGDTWRFEAVPNHWRVTPGFKELVWRLIPEESARLAALRSGEIDLATLTGDSLAQAKKAGIRILETPGTFQYWVVLPGQTRPDKGYPDYKPEWPWVGKPDQASQDNARKVRLALNLAVNKKAIIDNMWQGYGNDGPFMFQYYPENAGFSNEWKIPPYDPQEARQLLAEAGYPNGFEIKMLLANQAEDGAELGEAVAMDWEKIGLTVTREKVDLKDLIGRVLGRNIGGALIMQSPAYNDSLTITWQTFFGPDNGAYYAFENAEYDKAIGAMLKEPDTAKRNKMESAFAQKMYDDYRAVLIGAKTMTWGASKKVGDWPRLVKSNLLNFPEYITWSGQQ